MNIAIDNPYLNNQNTWNEIVGKEKANAAMWKLFALLQVGVTTLAVIGMIYVAQLPSIVPFIFKEDASGGITALGIPNQVLQVDNRMIANQLATFIEALRQVPMSDDMRKINVHRVKMLSTDGLFNQQLAPMMRDEYTDVGTGEQLIEIKTILPIAKDTWALDWVETKNGISSKYKATINYVRSTEPSKNPEELIWNYTGIMIKDININQVIGN